MPAGIHFLRVPVAYCAESGAMGKMKGHDSYTLAVRHRDPKVMA